MAGTAKNPVPTPWTHSTIQKKGVSTPRDLPVPATRAQISYHHNGFSKLPWGWFLSLGQLVASGIIHTPTKWDPPGKNHPTFLNMILPAKSSIPSLSPSFQLTACKSSSGKSRMRLPFSSDDSLVVSWVFSVVSGSMLILLRGLRFIVKQQGHNLMTSTHFL